MLTHQQTILSEDLIVKEGVKEKRGREWQIEWRGWEIGWRSKGGEWEESKVGGKDYVNGKGVDINEIVTK